jgi:hypothetical protein
MSFLKMKSEEIRFSSLGWPGSRPRRRVTSKSFVFFLTGTGGDGLASTYEGMKEGRMTREASGT